MPYHKIYVQNNLKALRKQNMMRQIDLARILGFQDEVRISVWEKGNAAPGLINLIKLCALFNASINDIYPELCNEIKQTINNNVDLAISMRNKEIEPYIKSKQAVTNLE